MKKLLSRLPFAFAIALTTLAVGPKIPCILSWSTAPDATGYWFYWRAPAGQYSDVQRRALSTNDARGVDMSTWGFSKGDYVIMLTATNSGGAESSPGDDVQWHFWNPNKPINTAIRLP